MIVGFIGFFKTIPNAVQQNLNRYVYSREGEIFTEHVLFLPVSDPPSMALEDFACIAGDGGVSSPAICEGLFPLVCNPMKTHLAKKRGEDAAVSCDRWFCNRKPFTYLLGFEFVTTYCRKFIGPFFAAHVGARIKIPHQLMGFVGGGFGAGFTANNGLEWISHGQHF